MRVKAGKYYLLSMNIKNLMSETLRKRKGLERIIWNVLYAMV
jgi:hypothetical protein